MSTSSQVIKVLSRENHTLKKTLDEAVHIFQDTVPHWTIKCKGTALGLRSNLRTRSTAKMSEAYKRRVIDIAWSKFRGTRANCKLFNASTHLFYTSIYGAARVIHLLQIGVQDYGHNKSMSWCTMKPRVSLVWWMFKLMGRARPTTP